jgi:hypothetical protein
MSVKTLDPNSVAVTFGINQLKGYADGTFIKVERNEDSFSLKIGADGEVARVRNANQSGRVTLTLLQTSASNAILAALLIADEVSPNGMSVLSLMVKDNQGNELFFAEEAWIVKPPAAEHSKEVTTREWVFECARIRMFSGGN